MSEWDAGKSATQQQILNCVSSSKGAPAVCTMCGLGDLRLQKTEQSGTMPFTMGGGNGQKYPPDNDRRHYLLMTCNDCGHLHWFDASIVGAHILRG